MVRNFAVSDLVRKKDTWETKNRCPGSFDADSLSSGTDLGAMRSCRSVGDLYGQRLVDVHYAVLLHHGKEGWEELVA